MTFDLPTFLEELYRVTKSTIIIFCGKEQLSEIHRFFAGKQEKGLGTVRQLVYEKCLASSTYLWCKNKNDNMMFRQSIKDIYRNNYSNIQVWNGNNWIDIFNILEVYPKSFLEITLRDGNTIKSTHEHIFYVNNNKVPAKDLCVGDVLDHVAISIDHAKFCESTTLTNEAKWFIGHFIAEGSYVYNDNTHMPKSIQIATSKNNNLVLTNINTLCKQYGATFSIYDDDLGQGRNIVIHSKILLAVLSEYVSGKLAYGKHFSSKCFNTDQNTLETMLQGYLDGDGHYEGKNRYTIGFTRKNYELAKDLTLICNIINKKITFWKSHSVLNGKKFPTWVGSIRNNDNNHHNCKNQYEIVDIKCKENNMNYKFYDIQLMSNDHTYCLYDGILTHNCNPSPMNGQHIYLSGIENAIWFKKRGGTFNARCKNTVFKYPNGRAKLHPTEKNHELIRELIRDNSNEGDLIFDPCCGSGAHCLVAAEENRHYVGIELNEEYYKIAYERLKTLKNTKKL